MNFLNYKITLGTANSDIVLAMLMEAGDFDSFEETEEGLEAYISVESQNEQLKQRVTELAKQFSFTFTIVSVPQKNWNEQWEASFQPVDVGSFCRVRAEFHPADPSKKFDLVINPKMAFGTGHHETTFMMIKMMKDLFLKDKTVLDFGSGTGILAILASKMGAQSVDAVDIEAAAFENGIENTQLNDVFNVQVIQGDLNAVISTGYDCILANINRNVILNSLSALRSKLDKRGCLLISGILKQDEALILAEAKKNRFTVDGRLEKGDWICIKLLY